MSAGIVMNNGDAEIGVEAPAVVAERVLIVEDDAAARVGLEQLVKSWGFVAESACDGEEALEKVTSFRPAIVITDLVMPRMDGLELLRALQQQGADVDDAAADRAGNGRDRGRGDERGRVRLPDQTGRPAAAEDPARQDRRAARDAARGESAAAPAARARHVRADDRQQRRRCGRSTRWSSRRRRPARRC